MMKTLVALLLFGLALCARADKRPSELRETNSVAGTDRVLVTVAAPGTNYTLLLSLSNVLEILQDLPNWPAGGGSTLGRVLTNGATAGTNLAALGFSNSTDVAWSALSNANGVTLTLTVQGATGSGGLVRSTSPTLSGVTLNGNTLIGNSDYFLRTNGSAGAGLYSGELGLFGFELSWEGDVTLGAPGRTTTARGHLHPSTDSLYDFGTPGTRWRSVNADTVNVYQIVVEDDITGASATRLGMQFISGVYVGGTPGSVLESLGTSALDDPNADRIVFWDDSAGAFAYLTPGAGLNISGTTLSVTVGEAGTNFPNVYVTNGLSTGSLDVRGNGSAAGSVELFNTNGASSYVLQSGVNPNQASTNTIAWRYFSGGSSTVQVDFSTTSTLLMTNVQSGTVTLQLTNAVPGQEIAVFATGTNQTITISPPASTLLRTSWYGTTNAALSITSTNAEIRILCESPTVFRAVYANM
jgi:hypothetical protein